MASEDALAMLRQYIRHAEADINTLEIQRRVEHRYPFDSVASEVISKAFRLAKGIEVLLSAGHDEEAYGLCRSLVECAVNLRYITTDRQQIQMRARQFVLFTEADRGLWLYWIARRYTGMPEEKEAKKKAEEFGISEDGTSAHRHWSGLRRFIETATETPHPIDSPDTTLEDIKVQRNSDYYHAGLYVHCSQPSLDGFFPEKGREITIGASTHNESMGDKTVVNTIHYLGAVIRYCLHGMNVSTKHRLVCLICYRYDLVNHTYIYKPMQP